MYTKQEKIILSVVCVLCIIIASVGGVIAAKLSTGFTFGEEVALDSLDTPDADDGTINMLLMGVDEGGLRSDTMMLACINKETEAINIISLPRDTRVSYGSNHGKLNAAVGIGMQEVKKGNLEEPEELTVQKVKQLTGLPVHYFMSVDFDGFKAIIDILGGVDFEIPFHMKYDDPYQNLHIDLPAGMQHLDGEAAHDFVRFRQGNPGYKGYATGDLGRIEAQQKFIKALAQQKLRPQYLLKAGQIFDVIKNYVRTNYTSKDLMKHLMIISKVDSENIDMIQLPGNAQTIGGVSYFLCDDAKMQELKDTVFLPTAE